MDLESEFAARRRAVRIQR